MSKKTSKPHHTPSSGIATRWMYFAVALLAIFLYGNTLSFDYTLDDDLFIRNHSSVQKGVAGIPEIFSQGSMSGNNGNKAGQQPYRPVTLTSFAIDHSLAPDNPGFAHFINLVLYVVLSIVFIRWLKTLFPDWSNWLVLAAAVVYVAHPVHIEVVANIKSRDEILAALFGWLAFIRIYSAQKENSYLKTVVLASLLFSLALLSKESIITLYPILFLSFYLLKKETLSNSFRRSLPFLAVTILYLLVRQAVIGYSRFTAEQANIIHNTLFAPLGFSELWGTKLSFLLEYLRLLLIPYPLSWDYSYNQIAITGIVSGRALISLAIHLGLLLSALVLIKKYRTYSFIVLFYFISFGITNNLIMIIGATVSERLLFFPSASFCIGVVAALRQWIKKDQQVLFYYTVPVALIYAVIVWIHTPVWKNNFTLFESGVKTSPKSARSNLALATVYRTNAEETQDTALKRNYYLQAITYYNKGIAVFDQDIGIINLLASCYFQVRDTTSAISNFKKVVFKKPADQMALHELAYIYASRNNTDSAIFYAGRLAAINPTVIDAQLVLTGSWFVKGNYDSGYKYARAAYAIDSTNPSAINNMAGVLQKLGRAQEAAYYLQKLNRK